MQKPFGGLQIFNLIFCVLFVLFAALQYNDPDPYIWIPIYLYAAFLCWQAFRHHFFPAAYWIGVLIYCGYAGYLLFTKDGVLDWARLHQGENIAGKMKATEPWIERTREFFGLMILIFVLLINYFFSRKKTAVAKT